MDGRAVLPVWCLTPYRGPARNVVVAWKDRGRADLGRELGGGLGTAAGRLAPALAAALVPSRQLAHAPARARGRHPSALAVVPAPSSRAARRERGREPVRELAAAVARGLGPAGLDARVVAALRQRGRTHDQVGLGARARAENLRGRLAVTRSATALAGAPALLVDDVLTTGATLAACEESLARAGVLVVGALVLAATPAPSAARA
jgi:predicted amidophosphoribosyltransferase